jgi:hypothetical protein
VLVRPGDRVHISVPTSAAKYGLAIQRDLGNLTTGNRHLPQLLFRHVEREIADVCRTAVDLILSELGSAVGDVLAGRSRG